VGGSSIRLPGQTSGKRVWRLQPNGTPDASFTAPDLDNQVYALLPADGGGLLIGGNFSTLNGQPALGVARLSATGTPDPTFASPTFQQYGEVSGLVLQTGDRLVAASNFGTINGQAVRSVVRFTPNGAPDPTFQLDPAVTTSPIYERPLVVEPGTDRILLTEYDHVQRLQPNGALDASFDDGAGADNQNSSFSSGLTRSVYQPDGKLLISGDFTRYNGVARTGLVRLTATGAVDPTFAPPVDSSYFVQDIQLLPNGSIAALYNDYNTQQLRWLDASGAPLAGFNGAAPLVGVLHILGLPDGTVLAGGAYTLGGILYQGTYKLTSTGTIDPSFGLDPSLRQSAITFTRQPDGKLLFRDGLTQGHRVRRLLPTGAVDAAFSPTEFGGGYIGDSEGPMVVQSTGKLVVGGGFNTVNGVLRPSLVRLLDIPTGLAADAPAARAFDVFPNPAHAALTLRRATAEGATATLVDVLGRPVRQWPLAAAAQQTVSLTGVPAGAYVVRIQGATGILTQRVVVE
ncbi:MAG: T9SS type A sorting domain-containing protein, partial [Hymenobacteraceae bacterium]|nr:T9SS type A sorting domain-containing protein [Hymenobacteraceae bacterium]